MLRLVFSYTGLQESGLSPLFRESFKKLGLSAGGLYTLIAIARVIQKNPPALCKQQLLSAANEEKEWGMSELWFIALL